MRSLRAYVARRTILKQYGELLLINHNLICNQYYYSIKIGSFTQDERCECFDFATREYIRLFPRFYIDRTNRSISERYLTMYPTIAQKMICITVSHDGIYSVFDVKTPAYIV